MKAKSKDAAVVLASVWMLQLAACSESKPLTPAERGRRVYLANCIICHNPDPTQPGSQGPAIAGSSRELVEARVVRAAYPPGYSPQRTTHAMPAQPLLASKVDDLTAFLAEAVKKDH
ncbi:MAG: c-type cytochrome [Candidatus Binatia bacterium]